MKAGQELSAMVGRVSVRLVVGSCRKVSVTGRQDIANVSGGTRWLSL